MKPCSVMQKRVVALVDMAMASYIDDEEDDVCVCMFGGDGGREGRG